MKYFQFGPSVWPPSCWRHASWPSSSPTLTARHLLLHVVVRHAERLRAEQAEHRLRGDRGHVAALLIEPLGIAAFGNAVADERQPRRAEREQLVRVDGNVAGGLAAERGFLGAVLQEVARHPVILARAGEVLDRLAEVAAVQLGAAFARRSDQDHGKALVVGHRHQRGLAEARDALDPDLLRVDGLVGLEVVEAARRAPGPGAQRAPVVGPAALTLVDQADDAFRQARAVVGLDAAGRDRGVAPAVGDQLLGRGRIRRRRRSGARSAGRAAASGTEAARGRAAECRARGACRSVRRTSSSPAPAAPRWPASRASSGSRR